MPRTRPTLCLNRFARVGNVGDFRFFGKYSKAACLLVELANQAGARHSTT
jgi:hypothetical protein